MPLKEKLRRRASYILLVYGAFMVLGTALFCFNIDSLEDIVLPQFFAIFVIGWLMFYLFSFLVYLLNPVVDEIEIISRKLDGLVGDAITNDLNGKDERQNSSA
jgi:hypothetical protein